MRALSAALIVALLLAWALATGTQQPAFAQGKGKGGGGGGGGARCSIDSVTAVAFGNYDAEAGTPQRTTGTLLFSCTPPRTMTVKVTLGPSAVSGSITDRRMRELGGGDELHYNLYQDTRGTIIWGDGINGGNAAFITGAKNFRAEIHGVARELQQVSVGYYLDTLRITIMP